jgi:dihydrofolate reductase
VSGAVALIAAVAENGVIGARGGLPWRVKADFQRFRSVTMGKPLIMGRKTFESIGRALDGRDNIVVTRQPSFARDDIATASGLDEAVSVARTRAAARGVEEVFVIGGGELFREAMPLASRLYITHIEAAPQGDIYFPQISATDWSEVSREALPENAGDTARAVHVVYQRRR